jgi:probable F420-dependent oxidoreductase
MPNHRPFRFGIAAGNISTRDQWLHTARQAEALGYATLLVQDHLFVDFFPIAVLAAVAEATTKLRLGSFVFNNDLRHPAVLVKEAAALDVLSQGRFEFGIGAGRLRFEYERAGISFDSPGVRVRRLEEAIHIIKQLFAEEGSVTFAGHFYKINDLKGLPRPLQRPHPPILIGGGGKQVLSLAAREADIVSFLVKARIDGSADPAEFTAAALAQKVEWVRQAAGSRFSDLELNLLIFEVIITPDREDVARKRVQETGVTHEQVLENPHLLIGTIDEVVEELQRKREQYGISYIVVFDTFMEAFAPIAYRLAGT